ncbi:hypothetical protein C0992_010203 [Termitomyces sp. T32_za158]|nr:hypothetical protein C0992_010203 [Termitomyces sp. T32_za158]
MCGHMRLVASFGRSMCHIQDIVAGEISDFTLDEKISIGTGGNIPAIEPITGRGWPGICLEDAPLGVRFADFITSFPTGINTAATFNRRLIRARGYAMGQEHKGKGIHVALGPMMNMGRIAQGGPSDYPAQLVTGGQPADILDIPYTEGLEIDYRHFDAKEITPRFEFGFGLSYTTFAYSNLKISVVHGPDRTQSDLISAWNAGKASPIDQGSSAALWLHRPAYTVTFSVTNTGSLYGGEIPQLYLHMPASSGEPPSILRGFTNVELQPGETKTVRINLSRYDLSIWDTEAQGWRKPAGAISFTVGASSRDGRLSGTIPGTSRS